MRCNLKQCFVVSPIGEENTSTRKRADLVLKHVIKPAIESIGFRVARADTISEAGIITNQIITRIIDDDLVIADLSERNPNVFYEVAIRQAARKALILIIQKGEQIPFDLTGMRAIQLDHTDLDSVEEVKEEIIRQAKAEIGKVPDQIESPISTAIQLQSLVTSGNVEEKFIANITNDISRLGASMDHLKGSLDSLNRTGAYLTYGGKGIVKDIERLMDLLVSDIEVATTSREKTELLEYLSSSLQELLLKARRSNG